LNHRFTIGINEKILACKDIGCVRISNAFFDKVWWLGVGLCFVGVQRCTRGLDALTRFGLAQQAKSPAVWV